MSDNSYKNIPEIADAIQSKCEALNQGNLSEADFNLLVEEVRELYDRLVVLRFKAFEEQVKGAKKNTFRVGKAAQKPVDKDESRKPTGFQLNFRQQAEMAAEEGLITRSQVSLIDAIEEEENGHQIDPGPATPDPVTAPEPQTTIPAVPITPPAEPVQEAQPPVAAPAPTESAAAPAPTGEEEDDVSLNDRMANQSETQTLAAKLQQQPIEDLRKAIGINQKFLLMNDLFEGENTPYNEAVDALNSCPDWPSAEAELQQLAKKYGWDIDAAAVQNFIQLVQRRYV